MFHTQLQTATVQAGGHCLMKLPEPHHVQKAETIFKDHQTLYPPPPAAPRNSAHKYYEQNRWQSAGLPAQCDLPLAMWPKLSLQLYRDQKRLETT